MGLVSPMRVENAIEAEMVCAMLREYEGGVSSGGIDFPTGAAGSVVCSPQGAP